MEIGKRAEQQQLKSNNLIAKRKTTHVQYFLPHYLLIQFRIGGRLTLIVR